MSVHRKKCGRWICQYRDNLTGKIKTEYFGRGLDAERNARKRNDDLGLRSWVKRTPQRKSPLFAELVSAYIESRAGKIEPSTKSIFTNKMARIILPELGNIQSARITKYRIDQYVNKRLKTDLEKTISYGPGKKFKKRKKVINPETGKPKKIKRSTVHREITDIQSVLNWAVRRGHIPHNPLHGFEKPPCDDDIIYPPTSIELKRILNNSADHLKRAITISYYTGCRPGKELYGTTWDDVDFDNETIFVRSAKKGGIESRTVPLHNKFKAALKKWKKGDAGKYHYIIHYRGQPVKSLKKSFNTAKKKGGITRRLRLYDLRHSAITKMLFGGADLKSVSEIAGHARPDITSRVYQHTNYTSRKQAIDKLPDL